MKGIVKWYNARKGYGFITPEDKGDDVFVHAIALKGCGINKLFTGSEVTFDVDQDEKGKRAKNLKITKEVKPEIKKDAKPGKKPEVKKEKSSQKEAKLGKKPEVKKEKSSQKEAKKTASAKKTQKIKPEKKEKKKTTGKKTNKKKK